MKYILSLILIAVSANSYADSFSENLLKNNIGTLVGVLEDGTSCKAEIRSFCSGYDIEMISNNDKYDATSLKSCMGELEKRWFKSYISSKGGGFINSSLGYNSRTETRVYFNKNKLIVAYQRIDDGEVVETCTFNRPE